MYVCNMLGFRPGSPGRKALTSVKLFVLVVNGLLIASVGIPCIPTDIMG